MTPERKPQSDLEACSEILAELLLEKILNGAPVLGLDLDEAIRKEKERP